MVKKNIWMDETDKEAFNEIKGKLQIEYKDRLITDQEALHIIISIAKKGIKKGIR